MNIKEEIRDLIEKLGGDYNILEYSYNKNEFIPGETPIYYSGMYWDDREISAAIESILIGKWFSAGEKVEEFENKFAKRINELFAVMVNSGSSANLVMIAALKKYFGWKDGDEIIVSVVGFPTTISVIPQNNLKPVFVDIEPLTLNFDINQIEEKITDKTRAIFVSPVLGNSPNIDDLIYLCEKHDLKFVLDCCDSLGSRWLDLRSESMKYLGEYAVASSHSFYPAHTISTGEGGMVTTNIRNLANIVKSIVTWGRACVCSGTENLLPNGVCNHRFDFWMTPVYAGIVDHKYVFENMGYNLKPLDLQGAIGSVQVDKLTEIITRRERSKKNIEGKFVKNVAYITIPNRTSLYSDVSWFGTPIICETREQKIQLVTHLEKALIQTRNYFAGNILMHKGYMHLGDYTEYPMANMIYDRVFFVGASPHYDTEVFKYFDDVLKRFEDES
jgi:CDP-6-deoxy-D-xylo-4-hexulose-3-dehydrase